MIKINTKYSLILILVVALIGGCDESGMNYQPKGDNISGYAYFIDTNFAHGGGYYAIALFENSPIHSVPVVVDTLNLTGANPFYYRISYEGTNNMYASVVWMRSTGSISPLILGTYGCDTAQHCLNAETIPFPNYTTSNYNIACWADTTRRLN